MLLLVEFLKHLIQLGTLTLIGPENSRYTFGNGEAPHVTMQVADTKTARQIALNPQYHLGQSYMDGRLTIEAGEIYDLLHLAMLNLAQHKPNLLHKIIDYLLLMGKRLQQYNPVTRSKQNVAHHYDLRGELYDLFLDVDRQYSCAYYRDPNDTLETAQKQKKQHLAAKLLLRPGQRILDVGSGWGGLALELAQLADVEVTGLTLSEEQLKVATRRAQERGLAQRVRFKLLDYRLETGQYDRIVSVGMFEHVGITHYDTFFVKIRELLTENGVALLHTIGRADGPGTTNAWIRKYIFPGGYSPALSEIMPAIERAKLFTTDIEILRLHYAETLRAWRQRFQRNRTRIRDLYDERFCRMWDFYLSASEATFRWGGHVNFQIQLTKHLEAVPLTRDYMFDWERAHLAPRRPQPSMVAD